MCTRLMRHSHFFHTQFMKAELDCGTAHLREAAYREPAHASRHKVSGDPGGSADSSRASLRRVEREHGPNVSEHAGSCLPRARRSGAQERLDRARISGELLPSRTYRGQ